MKHPYPWTIAPVRTRFVPHICNIHQYTHWCHQKPPHKTLKLILSCDEFVRRLVFWGFCPNTTLGPPFLLYRSCPVCKPGCHAGNATVPWPHSTRFCPWTFGCSVQAVGRIADSFGQSPQWIQEDFVFKPSSLQEGFEKQDQHNLKSFSKLKTDWLDKDSFVFWMALRSVLHVRHIWWCVRRWNFTQTFHCSTTP